MSETQIRRSDFLRRRHSLLSLTSQKDPIFTRYKKHRSSRFYCIKSKLVEAFRYGPEHMRWMESEMGIKVRKNGQLDTPLCCQGIFRLAEFGCWAAYDRKTNKIHFIPHEQFLAEFKEV